MRASFTWWIRRQSYYSEERAASLSSLLEEREESKGAIKAKEGYTAQESVVTQVGWRTLQQHHQQQYFNQNNLIHNLPQESTVSDTGSVKV